MKKVLAWAVALALVLSSFTMAFAADAPNSSQFKDASSINYTEAVDVMVATGVINGYPDGTFGPQKTVKRSEMAKMISVMLNAGTDIGDQYKDACTFADSKDHWAAGYIAYCAAQHIIDGRSADVFDPEKEVTGTEVAKMALTSLGYDSKIQGYVGENWAANVLKDANKIELFDGLNSDFVPGDPCSREAAAQILFNTLQANMVEYENGTSVAVGDDVSVVVSSKIQDQKWPGADSKDYEPSKKDDNGDGIKQLYEDIFGGDLTKDAADVKDDFGRPAHEWEYNSDDVGTYEDSADETFVTTEDFGSVAEAIADYNEDYTLATEDIYVNGVADDTAIPAGTTVELTKNKKNVTYVVAYYYELMQIGAVETEVSAKDAEDGVTAYVTIGDLGRINDNDIPGYEADSYVEDAYIAVCTDGEAVLDSYIPETKQGEITKFSKDSVFLDGTAYYQAGKATSTYVAGGAKVGDVVDLYLDKEGNALGTIIVEADEAEVLYGILTDATKASSSESFKPDTDANKDYKNATYVIFGADGTEKNYTLSKDAKDAFDETTDTEVMAIATDIKATVSAMTSENNPNGVMVAYTLDEDGNIDTMTVDYDTPALNGTSMDENGIMDGKLVNEDVVIFAYDADEEAWTVFDYDALAGIEEESLSGPYFENADGEYAAIWATEGMIEAAEPVIAFFVEDEQFIGKDNKAEYTATLFIDGKKADYPTVEGIEEYTISECALGAPVVVYMNDDDVITKAVPADPISAVGKDGQKETLAETEVAAYAADFTPIVTVKGTNLDLGDGLFGTAGAQKYKLSYDKDGKLQFAAYTGKYSEGGAAMIYQISDAAKKWDVVVYMTAADYAKYNPEEEEIPALDISVATLHDTSNTIPDADLYTEYSVNQEEEVITITAKGLKKHFNAAPTPQEGFWVGFKLPINEDSEISWEGKDFTYEDNEAPEGEDAFIAFYYDAGNKTNYDLTITVDGVEYTVELDVETAE